MIFRVNNRDGPARIGQLTIHDKTVGTPNILFLQTSRCKAPAFSDILLTDESLKTIKPVVQIGESVFSTSKKKKRKNLCVDDYLIYPKDVSLDLHLSTYLKDENRDCRVIPARKELLQKLTPQKNTNLYIVSNATQLFSHQTSFVDFITELRERIGYSSVIYLPCIGDPGSIGFLAYMGVDLFDSFTAVLAARKETFLFPNGFFTKEQLLELPCNCPACQKTQDASAMNYEEILQHNYYMLMYEIKKVRNAIAAGSLRELVEVRVRANPHLSALLRILDLNHYHYLEERTPIVRKQLLIATTKDALTRPEIRRFQERILQRFEKPASAKTLLLLPCSAKKPYSFSKTHKLFRERLLRLNNPSVVHEVIITSPLGLVPRELELTYPASSYDIAVTGHWDEDEKKMIRTLLKDYLQKNAYDATILHIPESLQAFVCDLFKNPLITCVDSPTSEESLEKLSEALQQTTQQYNRISAQRRAYENIRSLACYQFGPSAAERLLKDCSISGKYPYQKILSKDTQLGMLTEERGLISLTLAGAERLSEAGQHWVEISDDFTLKGSVFAPGIQDADESLRIGDEALIVKKKRICGVGVALMNGKEMRTSFQGEAVKVRHHI